MRIPFLVSLFLFLAHTSFGQGCCSGGSGSPIAGGASQGVLGQQQIEIASNFQYINSHAFKTRDKDTFALFDDYDSKYMYSKIAYGITKDFTFSLEGGYYLNKTQVGLNKIDTVFSSGIGDVILFPRYDFYNRRGSKSRVELTLGLGYKIPVGKHNDSTLVFTDSLTGFKLYTTSPPLVQPTTGSHDVIFYAFFLRGFPKNNFRLFTSATYIRKGWNSLGEKFGDYGSIGIFAGKTFFQKLGVTLQLKGEFIDSMQQAKNVDVLAFYNVDLKSTGSRKIMLVPQVSYSFKSITLFGMYEYPLYEYVNGTQVVTQTQFTVGLSYRFFTTKNPVCAPDADNSPYQCPMRCPEGGNNKPGKCSVCGMDLQKVSDQ